MNDVVVVLATWANELIKLCPKMTKSFDIIGRKVWEYVQNDAPVILWPAILDVHLSFGSMRKLQLYDLVHGPTLAALR